MMASYIPRFIRTAAHLHPSQLAWRVRYGLERRLPCMPILACKPLWRRNAPPKLADSIPSVPLITRHGSAAITLVVGLVGLAGLSTVSHQLSSVTDVDMPTVRDLQLIKIAGESIRVAQRTLLVPGVP